MSHRVDDLIAALCPNGVEVRPLGAVAEWRTGTQLNRSTLSSTGAYPVINGGIAASGYHAEFNTEGETITLSQGGVSAGYVAYQREAFWAGAHCYVITPTSPDISNRFLYYFLKNEQPVIQRLAQGAGIPGLSRRSLARIQVAVPPHEVQREIVKILDKFTELNAELETELEMRRRQHAFCQETLLTPRDGWQRKALGEIADVYDGPHATPRKTDSGPWYLSISSLHNGRFDLSESAHIGFDQYDIWTRRVAPRAGDTMFSYETRLGQAAFWDSDEPASLGRRMGLLRPRESEVFPRFLTLAYLGPEFQRLLRAKTVRGATVDRIPIADMPKWHVSIPSISEQQRIVGILDKFDLLVNDLSIGLPAELNARRRQYEYYRNRLLTFPEAA